MVADGGTWKYTGGSGTLKGITGKGTYKGKGNADGTSTWRGRGRVVASRRQEVSGFPAGPLRRAGCFLFSSRRW